MISSIGGFIGNAISFFTGLPGQILGALGDLGGLLVNVGKDLIQGFIDGVKSLAGNIISAVTGVFGGVVDAVKGLLGIASPSKVFMRIGAQVDEGAEVGIENNEDMPISAGQRMADKLANIKPNFDFARNINYGINNYPTVTQSYTPDNNNNNMLNDIITLLSMYLPQMANLTVALDGKALVGGIMPEVNMAMGRTYQNSKRGR